MACFQILVGTLTQLGNLHKKNIGLKNGGKMNPSTSSMNMYKVSEDGGSFRLPGLEKLSWKWLLEVKTFSTIYPEGYYFNMRGKYDTRFFLCDILCHKVVL